MAKNKTQARTQTRTHTPKPIPALLEGSFSTAVENRIAEINNHLAREGRLTNDPLAIMIRALRTDLKATGFTFERVLPGFETPAVSTVNAAPNNAPKKNAAPKAQNTQTQTTTTTTSTTKVSSVSSDSVRVITPEEIDSLQVAGSVDEENGAPYGKDAEGQSLAPYGVKKDGSPMKRRGRVAAEESTESTPTPTQKAAPTPASVQAVDAAPEAVEAASAEESSAEETAAGDFDDLESVLADLDI